MDDVSAELRETMRQLMAKELPIESAVERADARRDVLPLWRRATRDLGVTAVTVSEDRGGLGLGLSEMAGVLDEAGRSLSPLPLVDATVAAQVMADVAPDLLGAIADGSVVVAVDLSLRGSIELDGESRLATGTSAPVVAAGLATHLLVWLPEERVAVVPLDAAGVSRTVDTATDPTRDLVRFELSGTPVHAVVDDLAGDVLRTAISVSRLATALDSVGAARACLDLAVAHAATREQFGRPIGSFQAVKHRCAEMLLALESSVSAAYAAASTPDGVSSEAFAVAASLAYDYCGRSYVLVASETIQVLGGIGFTWEHPAHLFLKRAKVNALHGGTGLQVRRELALSLGLREGE